MLDLGLARFLTAKGAFLGALVLGGLAAGSCDGAPFTAPSGSAITLVASPGAIPANGASDVTAFVIEGAQGGRLTISRDPGLRWRPIAPGGRRQRKSSPGACRFLPACHRIAS